MGFRKDAYATVWEITPMSDTFTKGRISISKKDRASGEYSQDFGGYVSFIGTACAKRASKLKEKDRIKLGDVDVTTRYDKSKSASYTNFNIYSFTKDGEEEKKKVSPEPDEEITDDMDASELPF